MSKTFTIFLAILKKKLSNWGDCEDMDKNIYYTYKHNFKFFTFLLDIFYLQFKCYFLPTLPSITPNPIPTLRPWGCPPTLYNLFAWHSPVRGMGPWPDQWKKHIFKWSMTWIKWSFIAHIWEDNVLLNMVVNIF